MVSRGNDKSEWKFSRQRTGGKDAKRTARTNRGSKRVLELQEFQNDGSKRLKNGKVAEDEAVEASNMHLII